ncbi:alcohol dehydrogenase GroES domain-containing protein [Secundilactobacillus paracollinoides DSM 15502 = JCM 11969]|nr:alcohol dehydrogenase GroES domain-containing protein [Secundilactobacillus paracollinoides DSM 15502 = JCM 11969]
MLANGFDDIILEQAGHVQAGSRQFDKVLELVGSLTLQDSLTLVAKNGILCVTGSLGGVWSSKDFDPMGFVTAGTYLTSFSSSDVTEQTFNDMLQVIEQHHIDVTPTKTFDLAHTADAQAFLDSSDSFGKVVVLP